MLWGVWLFVPADDGETSDDDSLSDESDSDVCQYELIGVTVHTGTADGGHYYSFIRDRLNKNELGQDRWYISHVFCLLLHGQVAVLSTKALLLLDHTCETVYLLNCD